MSQYSRITAPWPHSGAWNGYTNSGMVRLLKTYCAIMGHLLSELTCWQGSFHTGYAPSAGTHDKADCLDLSDNNAAEKCKTLKLIGGFAWLRTIAQGFGSNHVHMGRMYSAAMAWLATAQDEAYRNHKSNGLGDLSHTDTSWCPRYRSIRHLYGPTKAHYYAVRDTPGYSQPGCTPVGDHDLITGTCPRKYELSGIAGTVRAKSKDYFVTTRRTFYLKSDFIKVWAGFVWHSATYTVVDAPAYGRTGPGLDKPKKAGCVRDRGYLVRAIGYADRGGHRFVCTAHGTYYAESSLKAVTA